MEDTIENFDIAKQKNNTYYLITILSIKMSQKMSGTVALKPGSLKMTLLTYFSAIFVLIDSEAFYYFSYWTSFIIINNL